MGILLFRFTGNTVYVHGHRVTEELLRKAFSNFGSIVNISMEKERKYVCTLKLPSADDMLTRKALNPLLAEIHFRGSYIISEYKILRIVYQFLCSLESSHRDSCNEYPEHRI